MLSLRVGRGGSHNLNGAAAIATATSMDGSAVTGTARPWMVADTLTLDMARAETESSRRARVKFGS
jgi:hypothetical protein